MHEVRRRILAVGSVILLALSGARCVQDLFVAPSSSACRLEPVSQQRDTLNIGDTLSLPAARLSCGAGALTVSFSGEVVAGAGVIGLDTVARKLFVLGPGEATIRVRPLSPALAVDTLYMDFILHAAVPVLVGTGQDSLFSLKDTLQLTAQPRSLKGVALSGIPVQWQLVSGSAVTLLDPTGRVRAEANGDAVLKATADTATLTRTIHVSQKPISLTVSPSGAALNGVGATQALTAQGRDARGYVITNPKVRWSSLNPGVATIDTASGLATAVGPGQTTVAASAASVSGFAVLTASVPGLSAVNLWALNPPGIQSNLTAV